MKSEKYLDLIFNEVDYLRSKLTEASIKIWEHPELGHQEYFAVKTLTDILRQCGFNVETGIAGMETAFIASKKSLKKGLKIAFMAEYDALAKLDHACAHNLFCCSSVGAAIALSKIIEETGGEVVVIGTPAEEGGVPNAGGKVILVREGYFDDVDAAFMCHGEYKTVIERTMVASANIYVEFKGLAAHAGGPPENGINALTAGMLTLNNINAIRQQLPQGDLVNGIVTDGGVMQNTIPDRCTMAFSVRSNLIAGLNKLIEKVTDCTKAAAIVTGCEYSVDYNPNLYADTLSNHELGLVFAQVLDKLGVEYEQQDYRGFAWDIGNVSYRCPTLGSYIQINKDNIECHTPEFREAARSEMGFDGMITAAKSMALTACEYILSPELRKIALDEFVKTRK